MSHIVESCPLTKLNGGLSRLHSAYEDAVSWLTRIREEEEDCAQRYEQSLQVGRLYRALILLGLALCHRSASVFGLHGAI